MAVVSGTIIALSLLWEWAFLLMPLLLTLVYCTYYVYIHPLAKYPGPFLAKVTVLHAAYHAWKGDMHLDTWRCHKIYGPVVRYSPNHLIFESPTAMREIYSLKANVNKATEYGNSGKSQAPNMVTILDKSEHAKRRKLAGPSFSSSNIKSFESRLILYIQRFLNALHSPPGGGNSASPPSWSPAVDAADLCSYFTFDIMTDFLFGLQYNLLQDGQHRHIVHDIEDTHSRLFVMFHLPALYLGRLDKKLFPNAVRGAKGFLRFIDRCLKDHSHKSEKNQTTHLFSSFVEAKNGDCKPLLSQGELQASEDV
ncbi:cytochrome P450 [Aspergillus parasiticus]|uniref:Cytochrome P450 n=1 Tax=Aspergillus parasiticus TaxID=5067 RepID=A0A5N6E0I6_ASPPA|nr:cytochrome P450 [Aspergillus parasiticus]